MRIRLHLASTEAVTLEPLVTALGLEVSELRSTLPNEEERPHGVAAPPDMALWEFSGDSDTSEREVRFLLGEPDVARIPTIAIVPRSRLGLEMTALRGGCESVVHGPVSLESLATAFASVMSPRVLPWASGGDRATVLLSIVDSEVAEALVESLSREGHVVFDCEASNAMDAVERIRFDIAILDDSAKGCRRRLDNTQPLTAVIDAPTGRAEADSIAAIEERWRAALRERQDARRRHELEDTIAARQLELQRVNQTLRRVNRAFHDSNLRLELSGNRKDELVGIVAHELKSPLAAMGGALDLLLVRSDQHDDDDRRLIDIVRRNNARMVKLVHDILELARLDAGAIQPRYEAVPITPLIDQAVSTVAVNARSRGIRFDVDIDDLQVELDVDRDRVVQVIINLLENAVKFSPQDGIVRVAVRHARRFVHLIVSDEGPGIPEADREWVFERFNHNAHGASHASGSGLGLTITLALVRLHGGSITVGESAEGGAQLTVTLPLKRQRETA